MARKPRLFYRRNEFAARSMVVQTLRRETRQHPDG
jgi:hypothetical protein